MKSKERKIITHSLEIQMDNHHAIAEYQRVLKDEVCLKHVGFTSEGAHLYYDAGFNHHMEIFIGHSGLTINWTPNGNRDKSELESYRKDMWEDFLEKFKEMDTRQWM